MLKEDGLNGLTENDIEYEYAEYSDFLNHFKIVL